MRKLTKKEEEIQTVIKERFLDLTDKIRELTPIVRITTTGIVEIELKEKIGEFQGQYMRTSTRVKNTNQYLRYTNPVILKEIIECCDFINNYFDFGTYNILKVSLDFNDSIKTGRFYFLCRFTKKVRPYNKKIRVEK